jgi:multisubunit Na+/H+ antiporter MnhB subunit
MLALGIDLTGLALITVGIGLFTLTFDRAPTWGWLSPTTVIAFGCAPAALVVFRRRRESGAVATRGSVADA